MLGEQNWLVDVQGQRGSNAARKEAWNVPEHVCSRLPDLEELIGAQARQRLKVSFLSQALSHNDADRHTLGWFKIMIPARSAGVTSHRTTVTYGLKSNMAAE